MLQHTPICTQVNFFTKRFKEGLYRLAHPYTLKESHRVMVKTHGPWQRIDFKIFVKDDDVQSQFAQQAGKGRAHRAIAHNGNVIHSDTKKSLKINYANSNN